MHNPWSSGGYRSGPHHNYCGRKDLPCVSCAGAQWCTAHYTGGDPDYRLRLLPWTVATTPYTAAVILEQGRVLIVDQEGDQARLTERQVFGETRCRDNSIALKALALLKSIESPSIRDIISIGLLRISKTITYVIAIGKRWDGSGFLAVYDTVKWSIRAYNTALPVACLCRGKALIRIALLDGFLFCGLN